MSGAANSTTERIAEGLHVVITEGVGHLVIDRPGTLNPITYRMWRSIPAVIEQFDRDPEVRLVVVRGSGEHFSAGADIKEFTTERSGGVNTANYNDAVSAGEQTIAGSRKPTLAVIRGNCIGGGCEIALACDLRIADSTVRLGVTPANLGIIYPFTSTKILVDLVGPARAKHLLFTAEIISADAALSLGLVNQVVEPADLEAATTRLIATLLSKSLQSAQGAKVMIDRILRGQAAADDAMLALSADASDSDDYRERVSAFLEKRAPKVAM